MKRIDFTKPIVFIMGERVLKLEEFENQTFFLSPYIRNYFNGQLEPTSFNGDKFPLLMNKIDVGSLKEWITCPSLRTSKYSTITQKIVLFIQDVNDQIEITVLFHRQTNPKKESAHIVEQCLKSHIPVFVLYGGDPLALPTLHRFLSTVTTQRLRKQISIAIQQFESFKQNNPAMVVPVGAYRILGIEYWDNYNNFMDYFDFNYPESGYTSLIRSLVDLSKEKKEIYYYTDVSTHYFETTVQKVYNRLMKLTPTLKTVTELEQAHRLESFLKNLPQPAVPCRKTKLIFALHKTPDPIGEQLQAVYSARDYNIPVFVVTAQDLQATKLLQLYVELAKENKFGIKYMSDA